MKKNILLIGTATALFAAFLTFWLVLGAKDLRGDSDQAELFSALYGSMALFGGIVGLSVSKRWGGFKSLIGRSVVFASLGLLAQVAGQVAYSAYTYLWHEEIPYPSYGDIGYFGSVILYILAAYSLVKALKTKKSLDKHINKTAIVAIPAGLLVFSYLVFLQDYEFDFSNPLVPLLDFGYPLGQAFYLSLGLLALLLSGRYLGGIMRSVILMFLCALLLQYVADFTFLYQVNNDTWETAGSNELVYLVSYYVMTLSLIRFGTALDKLNVKNGKGANS